MVRTPQSLKEAKEIVREERIKVTSSISALAGSRWLLAILATFAIAFATHLVFAPARLPAVGGLSLAASGLPPSVDFGFAGEQVREAAAAAERQGAQAKAQELVAANTERVPLINAVGLGLVLVLLAGNLFIMTKRRRFSRG